MNKGLLTANYKFSLGGLSFVVDIGDDLSAAYRNTIYPDAVRKILHYHAVYEIFFVLDEEMNITYENGTVTYQNCIVCIPPNTKHYAIRTSDYRLLFSCSPKDEGLDLLGKHIAKRILSNEVACIPFEHPEMKVFLEELADLFYRNRDDMANEVVKAMLKVIFFHIYRYDSAIYEKSESKSNESYYITINNLLTASSNPASNISLSTIAEALHLSEKQTSRIIKKYYNKPLSELILEEKLSYAAHLLRVSDTPVSEVASKSNFRSENYFHSSFKKRFGITPLKYRKNHSES